MVFGLRIDNAGPAAPEIHQHRAALIFVKESPDAPIGPVKTPLVHVRVLEDALAAKIVLAHSSVEDLYAG